MIPFALTGSLLYYIRSRTSNLETFSLVSVTVGLAVTGLDLISDMIFIIFLLNGNFIPVTSGVAFAGALFIITRFLHPLTFLLTAARLFGIYSYTISTYHRDIIIITYFATNIVRFKVTKIIVSVTY